MVTPNSSPFEKRYHFVSAPSHHFLYEFNVDLEQHVSTLCSSHERLRQSPLFDRSGYRRPIDCDRAVETLETMRDRIDQITARLKSADRLQALLTPNYYRLMSKLYAAQGRLLKLTELLIHFRSICMEESVQQKRMLGKAQDEILAITRLCGQIEAESETFLDGLLLNLSQ